MNWLYVGLPLAAFYIVWFAVMLFKRRYTRTLLLIGLAHIPYLLINLVAPFRGWIDAKYAGYHMGWLHLPKGPVVTLVIGFIVVGSFIITSRAFTNKMEGIWKFAFINDLFLTVMVALPVFLEVVMDPVGSKIMLGEYLTISGWVVALILFVLFSGPTFYSTWVTGKHVYQKYQRVKPGEQH